MRLGFGTRRKLRKMNSTNNITIIFSSCWAWKCFFLWFWGTSNALSSILPFFLLIQFQLSLMFRLNTFGMVTTLACHFSNDTCPLIAACINLVIFESKITQEMRKEQKSNRRNDKKINRKARIAQIYKLVMCLISTADWERDHAGTANNWTHKHIYMSNQKR